MAITGKRTRTVARTTKGAVLILTSMILAVGAGLFMRPCTPVSALVGTVIGCGIGLLLGIVGVRQPERSSSRQFLVRMGGVLGWLVVFIGLVHIARALRVPSMLSGTSSVGEFSWGGAWLAFILVPFVTGICIVFYSLGAVDPRRS